MSSVALRSARPSHHWRAYRCFAQLGGEAGLSSTLRLLKQAAEMLQKVEAKL